MFSNKKGNIGSLYPTVLSLILVGIIIGVGLLILSSFQASMSAGAANTAVGYVVSSISTLAQTWLPIIVIVIAAAIVLSILLGAFGGGKKR